MKPLSPKLISVLLFRMCCISVYVRINILYNNMLTVINKSEVRK